MKFITSLLMLVALVFGLATFDAHAGLQTQIDNTTNVFPGPLLSNGQTNSYALYQDITGLYTNGTWSLMNISPTNVDQLYSGGLYIGNASFARPANLFIDCSKATHATFEVGGFFANTNVATAGQPVTFQIWHTVGGRVWNLDTNVVLTVPLSFTNWVAYSYSPPAGTRLYPQYALRYVYTTTNAISTPSVGTNTGTGTATNMASVYFKASVQTGL